MPQRSVTRTIVQPLAIAVVLALAARAFISIYSIPSRSMQPTLAVGDRIAVTPYWRHAAPQRGDVVVFRSPSDPAECLVKRVIAVPGELIATSRGMVTIGGHALQEPYLFQAASTSPIAPQLVPQNCYFVMGDNRAVSLDSRSWGVLPRNLIIGRARVVLWSARDTAAPAAFASSSESWPRDLLRRDSIRILLPIR